MVLPPGYGYRYRTSAKWVLNWMLHNNLSEPEDIWVTYSVDLIPAGAPEATGITPVTPIWMDVQNGSVYPVFDVIKGTGRDGRYTYPDDADHPYGDGPAKNEWTAPYDGTIVATAGHLHPGGLYNDLWLRRPGARVTDGSAKPGAPDTARLFTSVATYFEPGGPVSWDLAMSKTPLDWRVAVRKGDVLSTSVTYDSERASWYESMGIMITYMAVGDRRGADPFTTDTDVRGVLTHGHLAENDNHGGRPAPGEYQDMTRLPSRVLPSGTVLPIADFVYVGDMSNGASVPTVAEGGTLVFRNDDDARQIGRAHV